jgi:hypothetical protein
MWCIVTSSTWSSARQAHQAPADQRPLRQVERRARLLVAQSFSSASGIGRRGESCSRAGSGSLRRRDPLPRLAVDHGEGGAQRLVPLHDPVQRTRSASRSSSPAQTQGRPGCGTWSPGPPSCSRNHRRCCAKESGSARRDPPPRWAAAPSRRHSPAPARSPSARGGRRARPGPLPRPAPAARARSSAPPAGSGPPSSKKLSRRPDPLHPQQLRPDLRQRLLRAPRGAS